MKTLLQAAGIVAGLVLVAIGQPATTALGAALAASIVATIVIKDATT